jgi:hypothetical protein
MLAELSNNIIQKRLAFEMLKLTASGPSSAAISTLAAST